MKRPFRIEEIMLDGVSGEVRGTVELDARSGRIGDIRCEWFAFRRDDTDCPTLLDPSQESAARSVVGHVLANESDLCESTGRIVASGDAFSPPQSISESTKVLAESLKSPARPVTQSQRRAQ